MFFAPSPAARLICIAHADDPRVEAYRGLAAPGGRVAFAQGAQVVRRALQSPYPVLSVLGTAAQLLRLAPAAPPPLPLLQVTQAVLDAIVGFGLHRGVVAHLGPPPPPPWPPPPCARLLVLERLADPANLGAALRNARAFGVDAVVCDSAGAWPLERRCLRASVGHALHLPLHLRPAVAAVDELQRAAGGSLQVVAACARAAAIPVERFAFAARSVLLVGNEGAGLSAALLARATARVTIGLRPGVDSLNAAAATAVLLHRWGGAAGATAVASP